MRTFQGECPRGLDNCQSLCSVQADGESVTFICCGLNDKETRGRTQDLYRLCFKSETTDTMYDHDELDLLDMIEVMSVAMATKRRLGI